MYGKLVRKRIEDLAYCSCNLIPSTEIVLQFKIIISFRVEALSVDQVSQVYKSIELKAYPSKRASVTESVVFVEEVLVLCLETSRGKAFARPREATRSVGTIISNLLMKSKTASYYNET